MTLQVGTVLNDRYRILAMIGGGGMGEVYRAADELLERTVAVKRLPPHESASEEKRERFAREAKAISRFSHPNVCALYDLFEAGGQTFLVMEFVEGENLEERLRREPLTPPETVELGLGIGRGLAEAHASGLVHRDLKPANIMLTSNGPKLLDFGIAKRVDSNGGGLLGGATLTSAGTVLGTVQYMSPEQLQGKELDGRSDLFSFGAVLYEAATGHKAFDGDTQADWIAAILKAQPVPLRNRMESVPTPLAAVIERLLEKDRELRTPSAQQLIDELRPLDRLFSTGMTAVGEPPARGFQPVWLVGALLLVALMAVGWLLSRPQPEQETEVLRLPMKLPDWSPLPTPGRWDNSLVLSPDGNLLVWVAEVDGERQLVRRRLDTLETEVVPGSSNARQPFFSPDGEWIGFFTLPGGRLYKTPAAVGSTEGPVDLARATLPLGGAWDPAGWIYYWSETGYGLLRVPVEGGEPEEILPLDEATGELGFANPQMLPTGDLLVTRVYGQEIELAEILAFDPRSGRTQSLVEGAIRPQYLPSEHLVYARRGELTAVPFDADSWELGDDVLALQEVDLVSDQSVPTQYGFSADGTLVYVPVRTATGRGRRLIRRALNGSEEAQPLPEDAYLSLRWSPSGDAALVGHEDLLDLTLWRGGEELVRLTEHPELDLAPIWRDDGRAVAFTSTRAGGWNLFLLELDADYQPIGPPRQLTEGTQAVAFPEFFTPDGRHVLFNAQGAETGADLYVVDVEEEAAEPRLWLQTAADEGNADVSPDGRWMVFASLETNRAEVYLSEFSADSSAAGRARWQVSRNGGNQPVWGADGDFYYRNDRQLLRVRLRPDADPPFSEPEVVFERDFYRHGSDGRSFDLRGDDIYLFEDTRTSGDEVIVVRGLGASLGREAAEATGS